MTQIAFEAFRKIPRLSRPVIVTEKIDGTNAQIYIPAANEEPMSDGFPIVLEHDGGRMLYAGSRNRWLSREADNFGFAKWCAEHCTELLELGPGRHFGEWWGQGIQRGYGLTEKRFSLFHTHGIAHKPACVGVVPVLAEMNTFDTRAVEDVLKVLKNTGSWAAPGFMKPEGIVVYHKASGHLFKRTIEKDEEPKSAAA